MSGPALLPIAVSMGEPAGIGPDIILKAYAQRRELELPPFIVYGSSSLFAQRADRLGLDFTISELPPTLTEYQFEAGLPVVDLGEDINDSPGEITPATGGLVIAAIEKAVDAVQSGNCRAIVTAPIQKSALYEAGFEHPGHTEFLASLCASDGEAPLPVMMLAHDNLRVVPLTIHVPLHKVPELVTGDLIQRTAKIVEADLKSRFGVARPNIGFAGLNPHAGEDGTIGTEDRDTIAPAIAALKAAGMAVEGPLPADTLFHPPHWRRYDAVVAMYHDQALIPIKTVAFDAGVNITLGLPIVRTSPDHGTALSIAGTGKASEKSFVEALRMAARMTSS